MKLRRNIMAAAVILGLVISASADLEISARLKGVAPAEDLDWSSAGGMELQARVWGEGSVALAATVGFETWDAVEEWVDELDGDDEYRSYVGGSASVTPVGLSMLYRHNEGDDMFSMLIEASLRYAFVDSDVYSEVTSIIGDESTLYADTINIDDAWLAALGATLECRLDEQMALELGLSYQVNLSEPAETWLGEPIGSTSLSGLGFHVGVAMRF